MPPESGPQLEAPSEALDAAIHFERENFLASIAPLVLNGIAVFSRVPIATRTLQLISNLGLSDEQLIAQHVAVAAIGGLFGGLFGLGYGFDKERSVKKAISYSLRYAAALAVTAEVLFIGARTIFTSND